MKPRGVLALFLVMAFCAWGVPAFGQSQAINGTIEGTTKDVQGGVLPGVTVTISHLDTGTQRVVVTNEAGTFRAPLLPLGNYKVTFDLKGFAKLEQTEIVLQAGQTIVLNQR